MGGLSGRPRWDDFPATPGRLGIVEASLSGLLVFAGASGRGEVFATLAYRFADYWLPMVAGLVASWLYRRRYGSVRFSEPRGTSRCHCAAPACRVGEARRLLPLEIPNCGTAPGDREGVWHEPEFWRPRQDSNLRHRLRRPVLYPLSYGGGS